MIFNSVPCRVITRCIISFRVIGSRNQRGNENGKKGAFRKYVFAIGIYLNILNPEIWLKETAALNTLLFADDQIIIQESEDELQRSIFYLNNICKSYNLKMSVNKIKTMAFKRKYPVGKKNYNRRQNSRTGQSLQISRL
jgi:hypothetical protein